MAHIRFVGAAVLLASVATIQADEPRRVKIDAHSPPECTPQFAPLEAGSSNSRSPLTFWRRDDVGAWDGDGWLGWTYGDDALVPVSLVVRDWPKERADDEDEVTIESSADVTFAMRCITVPTLHIRSAGVGNHSLRHREPLRIALGARKYELVLRGSREDLTDAEVVLTEGHRTQVLYSTDGFVDEPVFLVKWAGDLDGDGLLDVVVVLTRKYSVHPYRLLLSSLAAPDELVAEAARFEVFD
jgi:hypothetical protein